MLKGKHIVLGVTGGIAVYKAVDVVSRLKKLGADVSVIMTKNATEFVTPLTFRSLSLNYVVADMFDEPKSWDVEHISMAKRADLFLLAPATANIIGKVVNGIADDMVSTVIMATPADVMIAPAMNTNMYMNPIVQDNMKKLEEMGYLFIEPGSGRLACGDLGIGKLAEPELIVQSVVDYFTAEKDLEGVNYVVTAGPTQESIDPVRFITNHSSGKMGYEIAENAAKRGANVTLISGPTHLATPKGVERVDVLSTDDMYNAVMSSLKKADVVIKAAAVADYRPIEVADKKIKKNDGNLTIELTRNKDIALEVGKAKGDRVLVGFAAETDNVTENAIKKVNKKNFDMIVCNDISKEGAGFKVDTNIVSIIDKKGAIEDFPMMQKKEIAEVINNKIVGLLKNR